MSPVMGTSQHLPLPEFYHFQKVEEFFLMFRESTGFQSVPPALAVDDHREESSSSFFPPCLPLQNIFKHIDKFPAKSSLSEVKQPQLFELLLTEQMLLNHLSAFLLDSFQCFQLYLLLGWPAVGTVLSVFFVFSICFCLF